jgi:hypothetical protein
VPPTVPSLIKNYWPRPYWRDQSWQLRCCSRG